MHINFQEYMNDYNKYRNYYTENITFVCKKGGWMCIQGTTLLFSFLLLSNAFYMYSSNGVDDSA
jgi:hypothetical protein